jgi:hypothetical protein
MAEMLLEQEAVRECYMVHGPVIIVLLASLHVYLRHGIRLHPNALLCGDAKAGKSFVSMMITLLIAGTWMKSSGSSAKAKMNSNTAPVDDQIVIHEELQPSAVNNLC